MAAAVAQIAHVREISIRGNTVISASALQAVAAPFLGRDLDPADIENLRHALSQRYTDHGYLNSTVVLDPEAPVTAGVLYFLALEGRVSEIRVRGLKKVRPAYVIDRLRGRQGEVLNTAVLRARLQRLAEDPLFAHVVSKLEPGSAPDEAILVVEVEEARPYALLAALNNYRPPTIGEKAYDVTGQLRDLTGRGDLIDAGVSGPVSFSGGVGYAVNWQVPVNRYGSLVSVSAARVNTVFTEQGAPGPDIRSTIDRRELKFLQPVWGTARQQVNVSASIAQERESTPGYDPYFFLSGASVESARALTARLVPEYSLRTEQQYLSVGFTLLHAHLLDYPQGPSLFVFPDQDYFVWSGQLHQLWEIGATPFELESRALIQHTNAQISDLHMLGFGGVYSVRGFREDEVLAANGENFNLDFRWHVRAPGTAPGPGVTVGTFVDWAQGHDVGEPDDTFSSCGLTLRVKWPHLQADLAYGLRLRHPTFTSEEHGSWQDHGIHVQISTNL